MSTTIKDTPCRSAALLAQSLITELGTLAPFKGEQITLCFTKEAENLELLSIFKLLGAKVKGFWIPDGNIYGYGKHEWEIYSRALDSKSGDGPHMIVDYGGAMALLIGGGVVAEEEFEKTGKFSLPTPIDDLDSGAMWHVIIDGLQTDPNKYHKIKDRLVGLCDPTTDGVKRLYLMQAHGTLPCPVINIDGSLAEIKSGSFDRSTNRGITAIFEAASLNLLAQDVYYSNLNPISFQWVPSQSTAFSDPLNLEDLHGYGPFKKQLDSMNILNNSLQNISSGISVIAGSKVVVCGYEGKGRLVAVAMKKAGAHVIITETNPIPAYQATKDGFEVHNWKDVYQSVEYIVTTTGKKNFIEVADMKNMNNNTILVDCGPFDNEIDIAGLKAYPDVQKIFMPNGCKWVFPETKNGVVVIVLPYGGPTLDVQTTIAVSLIELSKEKETGKYKNKVYLLPKEETEYVAMLRLQDLGAKLTKVPSSSSCTTAALKGQTYLCKRKAGLLNKLTLPNTKSKVE